MKILALESSCDETALAIISQKWGHLHLAKNLVYSQTDIHSRFGGVVPEVAARQHLDTIIPLLTEALGQGQLKSISHLAVTAGPGLIGSLLLGVAAIKTIALATNLPLIAVNHLEGHIYSNWLSNKQLRNNDKKYLPALVLIVSGGHSELILMKAHGDYELIGQTVDDAVGEAYDKVAKLLDLGYPGGPAVSRLAETGDPEAYYFPRPLLASGDYNLSFSGLKTAVLYALEKKQKVSRQDAADICASFQAAVIEVLVNKVTKAAENYNVNSIMIGGGVAANTRLKSALATAAHKLSLPSFFPEIQFTGDNAAMIGAAAYYQIKSGRVDLLKGDKLLALEPRANWQLVKNRL